MKQIYLWAVMLFTATAFAQQPVITAIVDGSCPGGTPKAFEIYADGTVDFSLYSIERYNNGSAAAWERTTNLAALGTITDDFVYIVNGGDTDLLREFPSINSNNVLSSNVAGNNGDDSVRIILDSDSSVVDQFGAEVDGTGEPWEYLDSYATRIDGTGPDGGFTLSNWSFNPTNSLDNQGNCDGTNAANALENIVPFGSYSTVASTTPTINASGAVTGLDYFENNGPSAEGSFTVSGRNLTSDIDINVPSTDFEISETSGGPFTQSITLQQQGGDVPNTTIFVRLAAGLQSSTYAEDITVASGGAMTQVVNVSGTISPDDPDVFISGTADGMNYNEGSGPSNEDSFAVSGRFLTDSDVIVTATAPFEISLTSGGTFTQTLNIPVDGNGEVDFVDVFIRLAAGQTAGQFSEDVTASANGDTATLTVTGEVFTAASCPNVGDIIITEIFANPANANLSDTDGEYFEVYNTTNAPIDMQSFVISDDGSDSFTVTSSVIVPAMGYAVFNRNADTTTNGGITTDFEYSGMSLANSADEIIISCNGVEIDRVDYTGSWPIEDGVAAELSTNHFNATDNDDMANWGEATNEFFTSNFGTPGAANDFTLSSELLNKVSFNIYPNPISDNTLYVETSNGETVDMQVFSTLGKRVLSLKEITESVNISSLDAGIYLVKISQGENTQTRKLIVK